MPFLIGVPIFQLYFFFNLVVFTGQEKTQANWLHGASKF